MIGIGAGGALLVEPTSVIFVVVCLALWMYVLMQQRKLAIRNLLQTIGVSVLLIGLINLPMFYYNQVLFGSFYKNGWEYQVRNTWLGDHALAFSSPLLPSIFSNLFSPNMPLPAAALSPRLAHTTIGFEQSYEYALRYPYKGVFIQSPYLLCLGFAWFLLRRDKKKFLLYSVSLAFAANLLPFLYLVYYSPNSYDTRFFISFAALLSPGFAVILEKVLKEKSHYFLSGIVAIAILLSIFNAWVSNLENYAPHLTGEKRITLTAVLRQPSFVKIFSETFPNSGNYPIFLAYVAVLGFGYALTIRLQRILLKQSNSSRSVDS